MGVTTQPLMSVHEGDILMVDGHCNEGSNTYCNKRGSVLVNAVTLSPIELAAILITEGLNDGVIIKLIGCYSGGGPTTDPNADEDMIFAKKLAKSLARKKPKTVVGGYPGNVDVGVVTLGGNKHPQPIMVDRLFRGKNLIRYYDTGGNIVTRPGKDPDK